MKRRLRIPLRLKFLGALLFLVTAVVSVITFTMANMVHEDKRTYASDLVSVVALSAAEECRSLVEGYKERLLSYSRVMRDPDIAPEKKRSLVSGYFGDSPELVALYLYEDGKFTVSAHDQAKLEAAGLGKEGLDRELERQSLPMDRVLRGETVIRNGSIPGKLRCLALAHRVASLVERRTTVKIAPSTLELVNGANAAVTTPYERDGTEMLGGVAGVGIGGMTASAGLPAAAAYLASRSLLGRLVAISLTLLVIVALSSVVWARRITRPVEHLSAAARQVGQGRFDTKVSIESGDEIGALAESFNRMSGELHAREVALREAEAQLVQSEKMAAFGLLGAGLAHEVKNPLAGILGCAQISLRKTDPGSPIRTHLELIEKETKRCRTIIDNLLKFARQEKTAFEATEPNVPVENAIAIVRHQLGLQKVKVDADLAQDLPRINGNGNQLQQVLMNLMINAQQAMGGAGGEIHVITRRAGPSEVEIRVRDNGPGMTPEIRKRVFEPFFTTKPGGKGTGLGLSVSFGIIEDHAGEISVESEPGMGTTFIIRLPVPDGPPREPGA
jgi:signal transduction histidine kinase